MVFNLLMLVVMVTTVEKSVRHSNTRNLESATCPSVGLVHAKICSGGSGHGDEGTHLAVAIQDQWRVGCLWPGFTRKLDCHCPGPCPQKGMATPTEATATVPTSQQKRRGNLRNEIQGKGGESKD